MQASGLQRCHRSCNLMKDICHTSCAMKIDLSESNAIEIPPWNSVAQIPTEILRRIFCFLDRQSLVACLIVSHRWSEIARPFAWVSITLDNESLANFIRSAGQTKVGRGLVKSLTLSLNTAWPTHEDNEEARYVAIPKGFEGANLKSARIWKDLEELAQVIEDRMIDLVSFSLRVDKHPKGGRTKDHVSCPWGCWLRSQTVDRLLRALPASCIDLELDTKGREDDPVCGFHPAWGSSHLCTTVRTLLPRLRHLRLRLGALCPRLVLGEDGWAKAPHVRSVCINLNLEPASGGVEGCASSGRPLPDALDFKDISNTPEDLGDEELSLASTLQEAYQASVFEQLRRFQIMNLRSASGRQHDHFTQQDIIENETRILPFRGVWTGDGTFDDHTFLARNRDDEEFIGLMGDMEAILEDGTWFTSVDGDRWSIDFWSSVVPDAALRTIPYETRSEFLNRSHSATPNWVVNAWNDAKDTHVTSITGLCG